MNLLFWNLKCNDNIEKYIADIITENLIDIAVFSEYSKTDFEKVKRLLNNSFTLHDGNGGCDKVTLFAKNTIDIQINRESTRYTLYTFHYNSIPYILVGIHLPSNPSSNREERKNVIRDIVSDTIELERQRKNDNTIIIGDFNASPFDEELIQKDAFNAVLYKQLIQTAETVTSGRKRYKRFYNPTTCYISENPPNYGSFYYGSGINSLYWYCYDQALFRKSLIDTIIDYRYCKSIKNKSLLKRTRPDNTISDHLPLIVNLKG